MEIFVLFGLDWFTHKLEFHLSQQRERQMVFVSQARNSKQLPTSPVGSL